MKNLSLLVLVSMALLTGCAAHNVREGGMCKSNGDCIAPLTCSGGACIREKWSAGHKCEVDADCMGTNRCIDRKCQ